LESDPDYAAKSRRLGRLIAAYIALSLIGLGVYVTVLPGLHLIPLGLFACGLWVTWQVVRAVWVGR